MSMGAGFGRLQSSIGGILGDLSRYLGARPAADKLEEASLDIAMAFAGNIGSAAADAVLGAIDGAVDDVRRFGAGYTDRLENNSQP